MELWVGKELNHVDITQFIFNDKALRGFWMSQYLKELIKAGDYTKAHKELYELLPTILSSTIQKVFKLADFKEALVYYNENSSKGKVLLQP